MWCIIISDNSVKVVDDNVLWFTDNSVRSVGTCNLCLMFYYMASLASGGFVLTNGCLNHLFQVQVQEWFHVQLQDELHLLYLLYILDIQKYILVQNIQQYILIQDIQDDMLLGFIIAINEILVLILFK